MEYTAAPGGQRRRRLLWLAVLAFGWIAVAVVITVVSRLPGALGRSPIPPGSGTAGIVSHLLLGAVVTGSVLCLVQATSSARRHLLAWAAVAFVGTVVILGGTEVAQAGTETRSSEVGDAVANAVGAAIAVVALVPTFLRRAPAAATRTATRFGLGSTVLLIATLVAIAVPSAPRQKQWGPTPVPAAAGDECISRFLTGDDVPPSAPDARSRDEVEPLAAFDLTAATVVRSTGALSTVVLEPQGEVGLDLRVGATFADGQDALRSNSDAEDLVVHLAATDEVTISTWFRLNDADQGGPARLVALSIGPGEFQTDVELAVHEGALSVRFRTGCTPRLWVTAGEVTEAPMHAAITYGDRTLRLYLDGVAIAEYGLRRGGLDSWRSDVPLTIGNIASLDRGIDATIATATIHDVALDDAAVAALAADDERRGSLSVVEQAE